MEYSVRAHRIDGHGSVATTKAAEILLDTDVRGRADAFNPAELFLASVAACMIKGIERVAPMLKFELRAVEVRLHAVRQDNPPKISSIDYEIVLDTDESSHRLELLHDNVRKYGTISNTVAAATQLSGTLRRMSAPSSSELKEHQAEVERVAAQSRRELDSFVAPGDHTTLQLAAIVTNQPHSNRTVRIGARELPVHSSLRWSYGAPLQSTNAPTMAGFRGRRVRLNYSIKSTR